MWGTMGSIFNCSVDRFEVKTSTTRAAFQSPAQRIVKNVSQTLLTRFISERTGSPLDEIAAKPQLHYLINYLLSDHIDAKTMVTEFDYVDQHFLHDYARHYSQCFNDHPRMCLRVHFFGNKMSEAEFYTAISDPNSVERSKVAERDNYIGYCVIRPIADNFLGKICLKPYEALHNSTPKEYHYHLISKTETVSLFGIDINFDTVPMREQDKVSSACASSAIWTALSASKRLARSQMPALSTITEIALDPLKTLRPSIQELGLTTPQVEKVMAHYGFNPTSIALEPSKQSDRNHSLAKLLNAYVSAEIPVILSGSVYSEIDDTGVHQHEGDHLVCAVGYRRVKKRKSLRGGSSFSSVADQIERCYIHDDRYGPFLSLNITDSVRIIDAASSDVVYTKEKKVSKLWLKSAELPIAYQIRDYTAKKKGLFSPLCAVIACPPGLNLTFIDIEESVVAFIEQLNCIPQKVKLKELKSATGYPNAKKLIVDHRNAIWDAQVVRSNEFKASLPDDFVYSSLGDTKEDILISNMPKFLWRVRLTNPDNEQVNTDLYYDATEISQGRIFLGYIAYTDFSWEFWDCFRIILSYQNDDDEGWPEIQLSEFAAKCRSLKERLCSSDIILDSLFGMPRAPRRNLHPSELSLSNNVIVREDTSNLMRDKFPTLEKNKETIYNWVITESGEFVIGEEKTDGDNKHGHPTLIGYARARLAGEIKYSGSGKWILNANSGAYSKHLWKTDAQHIFLNHVKEQWLSDFPYGELVVETVDVEKMKKQSRV